MINVEIVKGGNRVPVKIKEPKGKHRKKYLRLMAEMTNDPKKLDEFFAYEDELVLTLTDGIFKNQKELDELECVEKNKIMDKIKDRFGFFPEGETGRFLSK